MTFLKDVKDGFFAYANVFELIRKYKLYSYVFIAGTLSLIIGLAIFAFGYFYFDNIGGWLSGFYKWETGRGIVEKLANFIGGLTIVSAGFLVYKYLILILLSPFMSVISEKIEFELYGTGASQSVLEIGTSILRGIQISVRNLSRELFYLLILFFLSLIPVVNFITTPLMFIVQAFYAGFGNMDYTMERYCSVSESISLVRKHRGLALANGLVFMTLLFVPILGLFLAPTFATVAATKEVLDRLPHSAGGTNL